MEYVDGLNLHDLAREEPNRAFAWRKVLPWIPQLCGALNYAHSRGVIHRDLKPANLMLDRDGELRLADFGLATAATESSQEREGQISGTPAYMSPQQLCGTPADFTDDIYSLGACVFELLAGVPVFKGGGDVARQIQFEPAPLLFAVLEERGIQHEIPGAIEEVLARCLSKNPRQRPASALELSNLVSVGFAPSPFPSATAVPFNPTGSSNWLAKLKIRTMVRVALGLVFLVVALKLVLKTPAWKPPTPPLDLRQAPSQASSRAPEHTAAMAFDGVHRVIGDNHFRWASEAVVEDLSEWVAVDLGEDMEIDWISIDWELAFAKDFVVRTRRSSEGFTEDPSRWTRQASPTGFREKRPQSVNAVENQDDVVFDFEHGRVWVSAWMDADEEQIVAKPVIARDVIINPTARGANNPGVYSIHEVEIGAKPWNKE